MHVFAVCSQKSLSEFMQWMLCWLVCSALDDLVSADLSYGIALASRTRQVTCIEQKWFDAVPHDLCWDTMDAANRGIHVRSKPREGPARNRNEKFGLLVRR